MKSFAKFCYGNCFYFQNGLNAVHLASKEGHVNVVTELLSRGANVDGATKVSFVTGVLQNASSCLLLLITLKEG